jgi:histone H3/H4
MTEYNKRVVNRTELRRHVDRSSSPDERMRMGDRFAEAFETKVAKLVQDAVDKARKEKRTTLLPRDVDE